MTEMEQLVQHEAVELAQKYNFYPMEIYYHLMAAEEHPEVIIPTFWRIKGKVVGFSIGQYFKKTPSKGESCFELNYVFIVPECRNKGIFSSHLDDLFEKYKILYIPTREKHMIQILNKKGFKVDKVCKNGKDISFRGER